MKNKHIYQLAIDAQSACNLSGLAHSLVDTILPAIREECKTGDWSPDTHNLNQHPVVFLIVYQMMFLAGREPIGDCQDLWEKHYSHCRNVINDRITEKQLA